MGDDILGVSKIWDILTPGLISRVAAPRISSLNSDDTVTTHPLNHHPSLPQVLLVLLMLMLFVLIICYVFLIIGLELFALSTNEERSYNYFQQYSCELVSSWGHQGMSCPTSRSRTALPLAPLQWDVISQARALQLLPCHVSPFQRGFLSGSLSYCSLCVIYIISGAIYSRQVTWSEFDCSSAEIPD